MKKHAVSLRIAAVLIACLPMSQALAQNGPVPVPGTNIVINVINVVDVDPAIGFGDTTPATPVGGNPGATVGEQRLEAYKEAARIWQAALNIDQQVVVQAIFIGLSCDANSGVLMEPFTSDDPDPADLGVDLTDELLNNIGWDGQVSCPVTSNAVPQINLFGIPTGVANRRGTFTVLGSKGNFPAAFGRPTASGRYLQDVIDACAPAFLIDGLGGQYGSCIAQVTQNLWQQGNLSKAEATAIHKTSTLVVPLLDNL